MSNELVLVKQGNFGERQCDFYKNENNEIFMTREQIGAALEYRDARKAISNIHSRNENRLNKFSGTLNLRTPSGTQETVVYSAKGVYEICRFSKQPKADKFMDWVWNAVESIRNGNMNPSIIAEQAATLVINRLQPMFKDILLTQEVAGTSLTKAKRPGRKPLARKLDENGNEVNFEKIDIVVVNANDKVRRYKSLSTGNIYIALTDFLDAINLKESSGEIREFLLTDLIFNIQGDIKMLSKAQMFKIWRFLHLDRNNRRIMAKKLFA